MLEATVGGFGAQSRIRIRIWIRIHILGRSPLFKKWTATSPNLHVAWTAGSLAFGNEMGLLATLDISAKQEIRVRATYLPASILRAKAGKMGHAR